VRDKGVDLIAAGDRPGAEWRAAMGMLARLFSGLALVGAVVIAAAAQPSGRGFAPAAPQAGAVAEAPTVESVSRQAQREIRACDDAVAFQCVADVLTRYAASLRQIARDRVKSPPP
jgi:hypothetical protein